jgi:hypothetical protein
MAAQDLETAMDELADTHVPRGVRAYLTPLSLELLKLQKRGGVRYCS